ncbi:MAG: RsmB/NOP family class I SAM-dependent RNA methyltransferase [Alphaproteobacteria bacterium]|nr:RsmB/NOP family class I SAM-dependent RNA methyltransferase [Alphaproteobacteria bacterium]
MADIRLQCAQIIQKILENKVFFGELKDSITEKDLPFANMLILTSLRYHNALNAVLKKFVAKKIPHKHKIAEYLLKLAICEILFMDTASYAVINQTVQNIKQSCDKFLGGLANAVLRKIMAQKAQILEDINNILLIPESFLPLLAGYSEQEIKQISESIKNIPPLDITVKSNHAEWEKKFTADLLPNGTLRIYNASKVQTLPEYQSGQWWIQDVAASLPVISAGNISNKKVIDLCAAPGGKTAQLAANQADVTAIDISENRVLTLNRNLRRLGFDKVKILNIDALEYMRNSSELYDMILLDAPCSATGTFRRHPEVLHIKNIDDVKEQANLQKQMLNLCCNILKKGGILVYSVCSICKTEGEEQIAEFLQHHTEFKRVKIEIDDISLFEKWEDNLINKNGEIRTMPYYLKSKNGMDSFFVCKMQRII